MLRLFNKTAVITGGSSGIGLATAKEFIAEGAKVLITGRNPEVLDCALETLGKNAGGIISDSASLPAIRALSDKIRPIFPRIDVLFINAGVAKFGPIGQMDEADFDEQFNVNVKGAYFTIQQLIPLMNEGSSIILNASVHAHIGRANVSAYAASKGALLTLAKNLSAELLPRKIRVNAISPGPIATLFLKKVGFDGPHVAQVLYDISNRMPLGRFAQPTEIARVAVFLASDDSSFLLGSEVVADGGMCSL